MKMGNSIHVTFFLVGFVRQDLQDLPDISSLITFLMKVIKRNPLTLRFCVMGQLYGTLYDGFYRLTDGKV